MPNHAVTPRSTPDCHRRIALALLTLIVGTSGTVRADTTAPATAEQALHPARRGHGSISIGYQTTRVDGLRATDDNVLDVGHGTARAVQLDLNYFVTDRWSLHAGIPYVSNVYHGSPHCPTTQPPQCRNVPALTQPHPESRFQDDGRYHGTWQDWSVGAAWHTTLWGNYLLTPSLTWHFPSHDYVFFSNAAAGQRIWRVEPSLELAHQFDFTNLYYRVRYSYVITEQVLDTRMNHHRLELEGGWFVNERFTLRGFAIGKKGQGYTLQELGPLTRGRTSEYWYHHDQIVVHDYAEYGVGADYHFGGRYTLSGALHRLWWGRSINNFKHSLELRLTRDF